MTPLRQKMASNLVLRGLRPTTQKQYLSRVAAFARFHGTSPDELDAADVRTYLHHLHDRGLKPNTVNLYLAAIRFFYVVTLLRPEVVDGIPRARTKTPRPLPPLGHHEVRAVLKAASTNIYEYTLVLTLLETGIRRMELVQLQVGDIDRAAGHIRIRDGKGGHRRIVNLSPRLYRGLRHYWAHCRPFEPWLFNARRMGAPGRQDRTRPWQNRPMSKDTLSNILSRIGSRAGLRANLSAHDLRRTYATLLLEQGVEQRVLQALLGHADPSTTARYAQVRPDLVKKLPSPLAAIEAG